MSVTSSLPDEIKIPRHIEINDMRISPTIISTCIYTTLEKNVTFVNDR